MDKVSSRHVSWVDLEDPTEDEVKELARKQPIHPLVQKELVTPTYRPKIEEYEDHLYLVLHFPVFDKKTNATFSREIDFIIFPYNLVTIHYDPIPQLDDFQQFLAGHEAVRERSFGGNSGHLLYTIVSRLFLLSLKELEAIEGRIKNLEEDIFDKKVHKVLTGIADVRRDLLNFRRALKPQRAVLDSLVEHGGRFFGKDAVPYFNDIKGEYTQIWNEVEDLQETLDILYETHVSLVSANTNDVTKILTIMASLFLPATLIATVYGMNFTNIPFMNEENGFWIIVGFMLVIVCGIYRYFKYRRWL